ncbi:MAG: 3-phosphoglycerate dehydrogenase, partial [Pseudomonadota bacterium]|nr:3-phosphoglycerate dehydrogenase [Pseudomonadota bacterium]
MPDIVITEFMDEGPTKKLTAKYDVHWDKDLWDKPEKIKPLLKNARALIVRNRTQVTGDLLDAGPGLKVVGRLGVGLDNIDL